MVPRMLDLLDHYELGCTWATVGFLFCDGRDELLARLPAIRPSYRNPRLSNYSYLNTVGADESKDPYHFAPSLIRDISRRPHQEIATHTFSHYYCLEEGQTYEALAADIDAALDVAAAKGYSIRTIVFPRNQVSAAALAVCREAGITVYRERDAQLAAEVSLAKEKAFFGGPFGLPTAILKWGPDENLGSRGMMGCATSRQAFPETLFASPGGWRGSEVTTDLERHAPCRATRRRVSSVVSSRKFRRRPGREFRDDVSYRRRSRAPA